MSVFRYHLADVILQTDFELPGLPAAASGDGPPRWRVSIERRQPAASGALYHVWRADSGAVWLRFLRAGTARRLVFPRVLTVTVCEACGEARCAPRPHIRLRQVQQLVSHHVLPLLLGCDHLVLHASAVAIGSRAVAFLGDGGAGKSTVAAALAARGARVVTDDALVLAGPAGAAGSLRVMPIFTPLRLAPDSIVEALETDPARFRPIGTGASAKRAVPVPFASEDKLELGRIYLLRPLRRGAGAIRDVPVSRAVRDLLQYTFEMAVDEPSRVARTFDRVTNLARTVPVRILRLPHRYAELREVAAMVERDMG